MPKHNSKEHHARPGGGEGRPDWYYLQGAIVQYYEDGLRAGVFISAHNGVALIRPIAPYKAAPPRNKRINLSEVVFKNVTRPSEARRGA